jgi:hypothetical protein
MTPGAEVAALSALAAVLIALGVFIVLRVRMTPEKRERKRRLHVNRNGRLGDAMVTETGESTLYYSYSVRGVQYTASQDISALQAQLPAELERLIGVASVKYASNNPANSILICEEWSGLRVKNPGA